MVATKSDLQIEGQSVPTVSVIIPTYNRPKLLLVALESVLNQTFHDFEVIVVDDGSTDETYQEVTTFRRNDKRVRYLHQDNRGLASARNTGIRASRGELIAFLDDDDIWLSAKLDKQILLLKNDRLDAVCCDFRYIDMSGRMLPIPYRQEPSRGTLYEDLMYDNVIKGSGSAVLILRKTLTEVGMFDENLQACEDQDLWRRVALAHRFGYVDEVLVHIRWHRSNMQKDRMRLATAKLLYLNKLRSDVPRQFRHHLPEIAYRTFAFAVMTYLNEHRFDLATPLLLRTVCLGPRYTIRFTVVLGKMLVQDPMQTLRSIVTAFAELHGH